VAQPEFDPVAHNREAWDRLVAEGNEWTRPVPPEVIEHARKGDWSVVLIGYEAVPRDWFPQDLDGLGVLGLAAAGGQQGPVLAAAGAKVTVFDNSPRQLEQDRIVAEREGLDLRTVQGDMRDLLAFPDGSFDLVFHPVSNVFCPAVRPVWRECYRVLRPGGLLLTGFLNPDQFIFDFEAEDERGELIVANSLPMTYTAGIEKGEPVEYSHTMTEQIGGQIEAGFVLTHFTEAPHHQSMTGRYMPGYFATRAVKPRLVRVPDSRQ
jgi:SAM-dependent methyltransferase